jgi:hypothetical protein
VPARHEEPDYIKGDGDHAYIGLIILMVTAAVVIAAITMLVIQFA